MDDVSGSCGGFFLCADMRDTGCGAGEHGWAAGAAGAALPSGVCLRALRGRRAPRPGGAAGRLRPGGARALCVAPGGALGAAPVCFWLWRWWVKPAYSRCFFRPRLRGQAPHGLRWPYSAGLRWRRWACSLPGDPCMLHTCTSLTGEDATHAVMALRVNVCAALVHTRAGMNDCAANS